jgi:hypothetical protein
MASTRRAVKGPAWALALLPVLNFGYTYLSGCNSCSCCNRWYLHWADDYTPKV